MPEVSGSTERSALPRALSQPSIRKLIRYKGTQRFLTEQGDWTSEFATAKVFADFAAIEAAASQLPTSSIEIYYSFDATRQSEYDFTTALH